MNPLEDLRLMLRACGNLADTDSYIEWSGYASLLGDVYCGMRDWPPEKMAKLESEIERLRNEKT